jgi:hypothetical protein
MARTTSTTKPKSDDVITEPDVNTTPEPDVTDEAKPSEMDMLKAAMVAAQTAFNEAVARELEVTRIKTYPVIADMLKGVDDKVEAVKTACAEKDAAKVAATVAGLAGYVASIQAESAKAFGAPRKATTAATRTPGNGYGAQALAWIADGHANTTAAEVRKGIEAPENGATHAALSRLVETGQLVLSGTSPQRFSLPG